MSNINNSTTNVQQQEIQPSQVPSTTKNNIVTYQAVLQPILDKEDGKFYNLLDYGEKVCICLHLKDKEGNILLNNNGEPKTLYRFYLKAQLDPNMKIGQTPFRDKALVFQYCQEFSKPQFKGHRPNLAGYYSYWVNVRDERWAKAFDDGQQ